MCIVQLDIFDMDNKNNSPNILIISKTSKHTGQNDQSKESVLLPSVN